jgi:uracil-DNA glycosylase
MRGANEQGAAEECRCENDRDRDDATLDDALAAARACRVCEKDLPLGARPIVQAGVTAQILIVGQAPGSRVHVSGIPWDDASGKRLRQWMGVDTRTFYDSSKIAIVPIGLCYPGRGRSGDLPPRAECAPLWFDRLLRRLPNIELTLLVGAHAQRHVLARGGVFSLTAAIREWRALLPRYLPLPHPSPRNVAWFKANPWFENEVLPSLRARVADLRLGTGRAVE